MALLLFYLAMGIGGALKYSNLWAVADLFESRFTGNAYGRNLKKSWYLSIMQTASLHQLKKELQSLDRESILQICLRLARAKKENKELLSYLIYDSNNEDGFRQSVKADMETEFLEINKSNVYWIKKSLRKILRNLDKVIRYSGSKETEIELRIHFLRQIKDHNLPIHHSKVLINMLHTQLKKINTAIEKVHEDLQYDYGLELDEIMGK